MGPREVLNFYLSFLANHFLLVIGKEREVFLFMVAVAQSVEPPVVDGKVEGSIPSSHPKKN